MQEQLSTILIEEMYSISAAGWPAFKVSGQTPDNSTNDAPAGLNVSGPDPFVLLFSSHIGPNLLLGKPHWTQSVSAVISGLNQSVHAVIGWPHQTRSVIGKSTSD